MDELVLNITHLMRPFDVVSHVDSSSLQIFLWEHFRSIALRFVEFEEVTFTDMMVDGKVRKKKSHPFMPRAWQWFGIK